MPFPTPADILYMQEHAGDNLGPNIIVCVAVCAFLAALFVALRLWGRTLRNTKRLFLDDWLILGALVLYVPYCTILGMTTQTGVGKHAILISDPRLLQIFFITSEVIYSVCICFIKWSILAFFSRVFPQPWFRRALYGVSTFVLAWCFTTVFAISFQCVPFAFNWDTTIPGGHCIDIGGMALATSIMNILTDFAILTLPLPIIFNLNVKTQRKWGLAFLFAVGGGACVVSITRTAWIWKLNATVDPSWDNVPAVYLSTVELLAGFLVACIPSYPVIFRRVFGWHTWFSSRGGSSGMKRKGDRPSVAAAGGMHPGLSGQKDHNARTVTISSSKFSSAKNSKRALTSWNQIGVSDEFALVTHVQKDGNWVPLPGHDDEGRSFNSRDGSGGVEGGTDSASGR
ncbi:hypothetical protein B0T19DRAFT_262558 [Cercophora scortea]|uniref:Rhodopsin domain-containing protein n=1 Tax=Cercophora scortea TaxID=314031 RepID=A0AAE0I9X2_9PEZI|nr:hypothetical protein B0T19DRAFT_262558 [Cercophora scortea]